MWAKQIIRRASAEAYDKKRVKYSLFTALMLTGGETLITKPSDLKNYARLIAGSYRGISAIKNLYATFANDIDDRLDTMDAEEVIKAGETSLGRAPSAFIMNKTIVTEKNWEVFRKTADLGIISMDDLIVFGNIFAKTYKEEALLELAIKQHPEDVYLRQQAADKHLNGAEISLALLSHIYKREVFDEREDLDLEYLRNVYPKAARLGRILEYQDDVCDVLIDYTEELKTGRPTANTVIAEFMQHISSLDAAERAQKIKQLNDFVLRHQDDKTRVNMAELPIELQKSIKAVIKKSNTEASLLPKVPREIAKAMVEEQAKLGIYSSNEDARQGITSIPLEQKTR